MKPIVAIVGRANVGKSTLFNRIVGRRRAIVHDQPGVTRDLLFQTCQIDGQPCWLVDSGGLGFDEHSFMSAEVEAQVEQLLGEARLVLFVVDGKAGLQPLDQDVARRLRRLSKDVLLVVNKWDPGTRDDLEADFTRLGFKDMLAVSAEHGLGALELNERIAQRLRSKTGNDALQDEVPQGVRVAFLGRPNVGKSSLINALVGEKRLIVSDQAGTTRDRIEVPFVFEGQPLTLLDTAGVRKRARAMESVEFFSVTRALEALEICDVALLVVDATEGLTHQDEKLAAAMISHGVGMVIVVNKWDLCRDTEAARAAFRDALYTRAPFLRFAQIVYTSATQTQGLSTLIKQSMAVAKRRKQVLPPERVSHGFDEIMQEAPLQDGRKGFSPVGLRYSNVKRPTFYVKTHRPGEVSSHVQTFWKNALYRHFDFQGVPLDVVFSRPKVRAESFSKSKAKARALRAQAKKEAPKPRRR